MASTYCQSGARGDRARDRAAGDSAVLGGAAIIATGADRGSRVSGFRIAGDGQAPLVVGVRAAGKTVLDDLDVSGTLLFGVAISGGAPVMSSSVLHDNAGIALEVRGGEPRLAHNVFARNATLAPAPRSAAQPGITPPPPGTTSCCSTRRADVRRQRDHGRAGAAHTRPRRRTGVRFRESNIVLPLPRPRVLAPRRRPAHAQVTPCIRLQESELGPGRLRAGVGDPRGRTLHGLHRAQARRRRAARAEAHRDWRRFGRPHDRRRGAPRRGAAAGFARHHGLCRSSRRSPRRAAPHVAMEDVPGEDLFDALARGRCRGSAPSTSRSSSLRPRKDAPLRGAGPRHGTHHPRRSEAGHVRIRPDGHICVLDFGIAKRWPSAASKRRRSGARVSTCRRSGCRAARSTSRWTTGRSACCSTRCWRAIVRSGASSVTTTSSKTRSAAASRSSRCRRTPPVRRCVRWWRGCWRRSFVSATPRLSTSAWRSKPAAATSQHFR